MDSLTVERLDAGLQAGEFSSREIVAQALERIGNTDATLQAWVTLAADRALAEADAADKRRAEGRRIGPLDGIPYACKDLIDTAGVETTSSSKVLRHNIPSRDATVVQRLHAAGAVMLGKTNTHEFAFGILSPPTRNPWDAATARTPGGSSGGTAAAVAAEHVPFGLGTDTGGSIRIPAALCGITGLKATMGRVPKDGVAVLTWSMDHVGPMCWTARDAALVLNALAGHTDLDATAARKPVPDYTSSLDRPIEGLRVGVAIGYFTTHYPDIAAAFDEAVAALQQLGAVVSEVHMPRSLDLTQETGAGLNAEASAWHGPRMRRQADDYQPDVRGWLKQGELVLATDYINARRNRTRIAADMRDLFNEHRLDVLVTPTVPTTAAVFEQEEFVAPDGFREPVMVASLRGTWPFNLTGQPALTVPCGFDGQGLPVGLQIAGRPWDEAQVLRVGHQFQLATDWHRRRPA